MNAETRSQHEDCKSISILARRAEAVPSVVLGVAEKLRVEIERVVVVSGPERQHHHHHHHGGGGGGGGQRWLRYFVIALVVWSCSHATRTLRRIVAHPHSRYPARLIPKARCWVLLSVGFFFIGLFCLCMEFLSKTMSGLHEARLCVGRLFGGGGLPENCDEKAAGYRLRILKCDSQRVLDRCMEFWEHEALRILVGPQRADASVIPLILVIINSIPRAIRDCLWVPFLSEGEFEKFLYSSLDFWEFKLTRILRGSDGLKAKPD
ncbi:uncharacterized protein CTRU02_214718 [Colletotrichum truncatum]|uniref:Uncharacterized protein n=1 Tax=Colletotrichum truncatum TaxID=5467 RepID=A0ACC3YFL0_COLTU|nr:uncharacterized protein CTRU02_09663 [Colletotrichum truncatum]KAF6788345.1 hypothetical protein CTRU02_09663 [Colletotrichum truncatum]